MNLLEFMMALNIYCNLALKNMMPFTIGLHTLIVRKVEPLNLHNVIILIKSVFSKDQDHYYNIFLDKISYQISGK